MLPCWVAATRPGGALAGAETSPPLLQRPCHMLAHQGFGVLGVLLQGAGNGLHLRRIGLLRSDAQGIAQGHGQVAQPAHVADAAYGAAFGTLQKGGFIPLPQFQQPGAAQAVALIKIGQAAATRKFVPGADQLAIVAAVDAVAQQRAQLGRNGASRSPR